MPVTFTGLSQSRGYRLFVDGKPVNQSVHGNDFWQTDYDPAAQQWRQTFNIPLKGDHVHVIRLAKTP